MALKLCSETNGLLQTVEEAWQEQCATLGEDYEDFAASSLEHAQNIIAGKGGTGKDYSIYACERDGNFDCLMHINCARLPGENGMTHKVMWVLLAPNYDYVDVSPEEIAAIATEIIYGAVELCRADKRSQNVKIHIGNIADRELFRGIAVGLRAAQDLKDVAIRGNW